MWTPPTAPDLTNENDGGAFQDLGTVWTPNTDGVVTGIRWRFPDTLPGGTVTGLLWVMVDDSHGTELARVDFAGPTAGAWNSALFATPVSVAAGQHYCASVHSPDRYVARVGVFNGASVSNGSHLTAIENLVPFGNGRFAFNQPAPTFPANGSGSKACYFADVLFETVAPIALGRAVSTAVARPLTRVRVLGRAVSTTTARALTVVPPVEVPAARGAATIRSTTAAVSARSTTVRVVAG